jgi:hypothetical protein
LSSIVKTKNPSNSSSPSQQNCIWKQEYIYNFHYYIYVYIYILRGEKGERDNYHPFQKSSPLVLISSRGGGERERGGGGGGGGGGEGR